VPSTRFGGPLTPTPIPGLDGMGTLCLNIEGRQVDPLSGDLADAVRSQSCQIFSWGNHVPGSLNDPTHPPVGPGDHPHWAALQIGGDGLLQEPGSNTLVVHVGDRWRPETAAVLRDGLGACQRQDAGLAVIVLFDDGRLAAGASEWADELRALIANLEAPTIVNEDVNGEWARALAVPERIEQPAWRLISSTGGVTWMSDDAVTAEALGSALHDHLFPSAPPVARPLRAIDPSIVARPAIPVIDPDGPPLPLRGRGAARRALVFAMAGSTASDARVAQLTAARGSNDAVIVAVVRGASAEEARAFAARFGKGVVAVPDPDGKIAAAAGVRYWPTSLSIDELGMVTSVDVGLEEDAARGGRSA
jgi:hypothetical protein